MCVNVFRHVDLGSGGVPPLGDAGPPEGACPDGQQGRVSLPNTVPEGPGGVVVQQRVGHAVGRRQTQRHHHGALQSQCYAAVPASADRVQV